MKVSSFLSLLSILIMMSSCDDILEEDISSAKIQGIYPRDNDTVYGNTVNFSWEYINDTDDYRVQVFDENQTYILDSLVNSINFTYSLNPGSYKWRVRGENFAYYSPYSLPLKFTVTPSDDLNTQTVIQHTPSNGHFFNTTDITFTWGDLPAVDYYELEISRINNGETTEYQESNIENTSLTIDESVINEEGKYTWKVRGVNETSGTVFSERDFYIDTSSPSAPLLSSPDDQETFEVLNPTVIFNWQTVNNNSNYQSAVSYLIEVSSQENFSNIIFSEDTQNTSIQFEFDDPGDYYWRVFSYDLAGNDGGYSIRRTFTIEE
ncbi:MULTISPECIES: hypothetical protein [Mesonia]|uniref:Uncharacterized protein n=1 Tax=Mesonia oceanica TaxID=2687242 RepID=A0AC61Y5X7_9FLAO|nr:MULTISPECIES: hypothetical protein [Mesonia]VVU99589.1 hypothetical protein FVB9532_00844 [Mesonia oceanica]|tara:strand:+ start:54105 stop:55067 length:963 start_codon:yes stop_codon:yes gene_type:complete